MRRIGPGHQKHCIAFLPRTAQDRMANTRSAKPSDVATPSQGTMPAASYVAIGTSLQAHAQEAKEHRKSTAPPLQVLVPPLLSLALIDRQYAH